MTYQEAFFGIVYLALNAIGDIVDEDFNRFHVATNRMQLFNGLTTEIANKYGEKLEPYIDSDWEGFIVQAAAVLPSELRETAFVISCDLVLRNGFVPPKAEGYLEMVKQALRIDDELATKAFIIMQIKNRG